MPPGTAADDALTLRGSDHDIEVGPGHDYPAILGDAHGIRNLPAGRKASWYSSAAGSLVRYLVTNDPAVLSTAIHSKVIGPARLHAALTFLVAHGVPNNAQLSDADFDALAEDVFGRVDWSAPPSELIVVHGDLHDTEDPAGAIGGAGTLWRRSAQVCHLQYQRQ